MTNDTVKRKWVLVLAGIMLTVLLNGCTGDAEHKSAEMVILDCDMGYMNDDMLALSLLLQAEAEGGFEIAGITLEGGNVFIDAKFEIEGVLQTCGWENTNVFLESIGRSDIPVYRGTDYPLGINKSSVSELTAYFENADYLLDNDGYGAIHAFENTVNGSLCDSDDAANFMIDCVQKHPGNVVIIAIGPTMNIADAIARDPSFAENVKAVYYMGGALGERYEAETTGGKKVTAVTGANVTPYAEYNALYDPTALDVCLTAGFPRQFLVPAELSIDFDSKVVKALEMQDCKMARIWYEHYKNEAPQYPYWDPLTAFAYLKPACAVPVSEKYITVNTDREDDRFGETSALAADEYSVLSAQEKSKYGKVTVIGGVKSFWDEAIRLLCSED